MTSPHLPTATRSRENTRTRLLDAALEVFTEVGLDAASVEAVTERAGFTRGAFYSNFESKDELFLALIDRETRGKLEAVAERARAIEGSSTRELSTGDLVSDLVGVAFAEDMPPALISELRVQALRNPATAAAYLRWQDAIIARVERIVDDVVSRLGLELRLPVAEAARVFVELAEETGTRAALEGLDDVRIARAVNDRLAMLAAVFIRSGP